MWSLNLSFALGVLYAIFASRGTHSLNYSDLEALGVNCPWRDSCRGYQNDMDYTNRSCECDQQCAAYRDCCIDASTSSRAVQPKTDDRCLHYGNQPNTGVFVVSKCRDDWQGPREVREKCVGRLNMSDPLTSAPATDTTRRVTYRNLYCAECNNANLTSLSTLSFVLTCDGLQDVPKEQILRDITYNSQRDLWGIYRSNSGDGGTEFVGCDIHFDVPARLNNSVRFCRSSLVSTCAPDWKRNAIRRACSEYMAVVYDNQVAYRNPHCAICNHKTVDEVSCTAVSLSRRRPSFFQMVFDIVGEGPPDCRSGQKYDPFSKTCRPLVCLLPGCDSG